MNRFLKILTVILLMTLTTVHTYAQSASDAYNKGVALMNKGDYQGAIASFKASMAINKSAANVKKCNAQISKCNRLAKKKTTDRKDEPKKTTQKTLVVSAKNVGFEAAGGERIIGVLTQPESNDWIANVASEHESWCKLSKSMNGKELQIECLPSNSTISRYTGITVIYDQETQFIQLTQKGKDAEITAHPNDVKFKLKGGTEKVAISCNSDTLYADNKNWQLSKRPDWCEVYVGSSNEITVKVKEVKKGDPIYESGRSGDIILKSQNQECIIRVDQRKRNIINSILKH
jgi:hypothetical protein